MFFRMPNAIALLCQYPGEVAGDGARKQADGGLARRRARWAAYPPGARLAQRLAPDQTSHSAARRVPAIKANLRSSPQQRIICHEKGIRDTPLLEGLKQIPPLVFLVPAAANLLWNNLLEPEGNKSSDWVPVFTQFLCPSPQRPFLCTWRSC